MMYLTPDTCPGFTGRVMKLGKRFAILEIGGMKYAINRVYLDYVYRDMPTGPRELELPIGAYINAKRRFWTYASRGICFIYTIDAEKLDKKDTAE